MKALLIIAHGSRRKESNEEIFALTDRITASDSNPFAIVCCAFLELTGPSVDEVIAELAGSGMQEIIVFPYFLASGTHVANDVPRFIQQSQEEHPGIRFTITPHLGGLDGIGDIILDEAKKEPSR